MSTLLSQKLNIGTNLTPIQGPLPEGLSSISDIINRILLFVIPIASIILFIALIFGGFSVLTSQGNPEKIKTGKGAIVAALIGFAILVFSFSFVKLIGFMLGLTEANSPF
ncbi:MAG: hypothetical protein ABIO02_04325 [Patescibacteria group bacterium]